MTFSSWINSSDLTLIPSVVLITKIRMLWRPHLRMSPSGQTTKLLFNRRKKPTDKLLNQSMFLMKRPIIMKQIISCWAQRRSRLINSLSERVSESIRSKLQPLLSKISSKSRSTTTKLRDTFTSVRQRKVSTCERTPRFRKRPTSRKIRTLWRRLKTLSNNLKMCILRRTIDENGGNSASNLSS